MFPPISYERLESLIQSEDLKYQFDNDGEIGLGFEPFNSWLNCNDDWFRAYAIWRKSPRTPEQFALANELVNHINTNMTQPKACLAQSEKHDRASIVLEISVPQLKSGYSDVQLTEMFRGIFGSFFSACEMLEELAGDLPPRWDEDEPGDSGAGSSDAGSDAAHEGEEK